MGSRKTVMALTDAEGSVVERYAYTPYGARTITSADGEVREASAVGNDVGFTGRYWDAETALWYYRARQMDAELGRFVGRDPLDDASPADIASRYSRAGGVASRRSHPGRALHVRPEGGRPGRTYAYVDNSPMYALDPSGWASGDSFPSQHAAASDFGKFYGGGSINSNLEAGSTIYRNSNGTYSYGIANVGTSRGVDPSTPVPPGAQGAANIHTHGAYEAGATNNNFSGQRVDLGNGRYAYADDLNRIHHDAAYSGHNGGYVVTPDGSLLYYDAKTQTTHTLSTDMPSDPNDPGRKNQNDPRTPYTPAC
jgi:RHS repeat-associated protein